MFKIRLFGPFEISADHESLPRSLIGRKSKWLLALLALKQGQAVRRDWLANLLWPDSNAKLALRNLRQLMSDELRPVLGNALSSPSPSTLMLTDIDVWVDAIAFDAAIKAKTEPSLKVAVELYRGPLLDGFDEEWIVQERNYRKNYYLAALEELAERAMSQHSLVESIHWLQQLILADQFRESAYRALMQALADRGDQNAVVKLYRDLRLLLHNELNSSPDGETSMLFQRLSSQAHAPILPSSDQEVTGPPHRLPVPITELIGREHCIGEVVSQLTKYRMVTLTGAGGIGKTRLSISVGEALLGEYADGVWFVELAPLADSTLVAQTIATVMGIQEEVSKSIEEKLLTALSARSLLLILDNCEHLVELIASLANRLLQSCPGVRVLATSQIPLDILGEMVYQVPPLHAPDPDAFTLSDTEQSLAVADYPAIHLFMERARARRSSFVLTHKNASAIVRICHWLNGIPLAIELAAARINALTAGQIAERLDDCFQLLTGGSRTALSRHQTLRETIAWSFKLLTEREQHLLTRLSVFTNGWSLEGAEAVCGETLYPQSLLDLIMSLENKSLITFVDNQDVPRYFMLETIRKYAATQGEGITPETVAHHTDYYLSLADRAADANENAISVSWIEHLAQEHDNFRAVLKRQLSEAQSNNFGLRLATRLAWFWEIRGYFREGRSWLRASLEAGTMDDALRARALNWFGVLAAAQGDYQEARASHNESLELNRRIDDPKITAQALNGLGVVVHHEGDYIEARSLYERSLAFFRSIHNTKGIAVALSNIGRVALDQGNFGEARRFLEESLQLERGLDNKLRIARCLQNIAVTVFRQGDTQKAKELWDESMVINREIGNISAVANVLNSLAHLEFVRDNAVEARKLLDESLRIRRHLGDKRGIHTCINNLGYLAMATKDYTRARTLFLESLDIACQIHQKRGQVIAYGSLIEASLLLDNQEDARRYLLKTIQTLQNMNDLFLSASILYIAGKVAIAQQTPDVAVQLIASAEIGHQTIQSRLPPQERAETDRMINALKMELGDNAFNSAYDSGAAMSLTEAMNFACVRIFE